MSTEYADKKHFNLIVDGRQNPNTWITSDIDTVAGKGIYLSLALLLAALLSVPSLT